MAIQEVRASRLDYLALATELLQRVRLAEAGAGLWEAADLQWWWRTPRRSDTIDQVLVLVFCGRQHLDQLGLPFGEEPLQ